MGNARGARVDHRGRDGCPAYPSSEVSGAAAPLTMAYGGPKHHSVSSPNSPPRRVFHERS